MSEKGAKLVFRADAAFDALGGVLLLLGTWDALYMALQLPQAKPAVFVQLGGAVLIGFAVVLSAAGGDRALHRPVARAAAVANGLGALVLVAWFVLEGPNTGPVGTLLLLVVTVLLALFALAQARIATAGRSPARGRPGRSAE